MAASHITVRNIDADIIERLDEEANRELRSREKQALWVLKQYARSTRASERHRQDVAQRLNRALSNVQQLRGFSRWRPSTLAERAGFARAGCVIDAFEAEAELTHEELDGLAAELGVNPEWLKHGDVAAAYEWRYWRWSGDVDKTIEQLMTPRIGELESLHLLRSDDSTGGLYIIQKLRDSARCEAFYTPYHLSNEIGSGGAAALVLVFTVLAELYKRYVGGSDSHITSHLVPESLTRRLNDPSEAIHPLNVIQQSRSALWWEDIWDKQMYDRNEYWPGQGAWSQRIIASMNTG